MRLDLQLLSHRSDSLRPAPCTTRRNMTAYGLDSPISKDPGAPCPWQGSMPSPRVARSLSAQLGAGPGEERQAIASFLKSVSAGADRAVWEHRCHDGSRGTGMSQQPADAYALCLFVCCRGRAGCSAAPAAQWAVRPFCSYPRHPRTSSRARAKQPAAASSGAWRC